MSAAGKVKKMLLRVKEPMKAKATPTAAADNERHVGVSEGGGRGLAWAPRARRVNSDVGETRLSSSRTADAGVIDRASTPGPTLHGRTQCVTNKSRQHPRTVLHGERNR
jgi:hypothetical protein